MKKILICFFTLSLLLVSLAGCGLLESQVPEEQVYTCREFSITLPSEFTSQQQSLIGGNSEVFYSDDYTIKVQRYSFDNITPKDGHEFPALSQFVYDIASFVEENQLAVLNDKGVLGYDYADENGGNKQLVAFFESENAYWFVSFFSDSVDYETAKGNYLEWINTVTFE